MKADQETADLVSVVIPTFNRAWALPACVRSVMAQTYRPIECLVVDDGSTDDTPAVLEQLAASCPAGITLHGIRQTNGGANSARNRGLRATRGAFVAYLDSDDLLQPDSVAVRVHALRTDPAAELAYGMCEIQNEKGEPLRTLNAPWPAAGEARVTAYLFHTSSPLIRRTLSERAGLWREDDVHGQEVEYFARLKYFAQKVIFIDQVLSIYVRHSSAQLYDQSAAFYRSLFRMQLAIKALVLHGPFDNAPERAQLALEFSRVAHNAYRQQEYALARVALRESLGLRMNWRTAVRFVMAAALSLVRPGTKVPAFP